MKSVFDLPPQPAKIGRSGGPGLRKKLLLAGAFASAAVLLAGCRLDMHDQPKFKPLRENDFYADKRSSRPLIGGTVARGQLDADTYFHSGMVNGKEGDVMPFAVTPSVLERGRERFNIYCSPCHSQLGDGNGMIVQRGFKRPPSYHIDRLRKAPIGHFFHVMTSGYGAMADYSAQVSERDRWAIAAYIRALQLSQNATRSDVPPGMMIAAHPPQINTNWPPPLISPNATHGEGGGDIQREGKNE
jgi:mono/diheme cytochrome c family protein